ncbi:MAG: undecaprenyl/decaprenyl-phosphate alpha-N-acetylglucosaminyl 1-phosphate transferase [Thermomicrobiaceae bacterium]|nr:undecaprenyl/decaprenyl-phosphate alpha-N-acetylglucosaminyl 1-phosphate transferase [Thermomicrobiaceae bacterium]
MSHALIALIVGVVTAALSASLVPPLIRLAHRLGMLDMPGEARRVHTRPVPRIGGLAIFAAFVVGVALSFSLPVQRFPIEVERISLLLAGAVLVVGVMLYDDLVGLGPVPKLLWQVAATAIVVLPRLRGPDHGLVIDQFNNPFGGVVHLPLPAAIGFTFLWTVGMMNTLNWIDGLDGLAGSVTLVVSAVLFFHTYFRPEGNPQFTISLLPLALGAAVIGFLPFNWHPARIIMGDTGAMFLGFALAIISIIGGAKIATALLALWLPILDVAWVITYRVLNGRSPLRADRGHLHHRLLDLGWSQQRIVGLFVAISAAMGAVALLLPWAELKLFALVGAGVVGLALLTVLARRAEQASGRPMSVTELSRRP